MKLETNNLALFVDFENLAIGAQQSGYKRFELKLILRRLREIGRILFSRAYSDWSSFQDYRLEFHSAGIEMFEIPSRHQGGKNSADIRMVVDALDLCYTRPHFDTFVLASGDSDCHRFSISDVRSTLTPCFTCAKCSGAASAWSSSTVL